MIEHPITFQKKSEYLEKSANAPEPSTCVDAEPYALQVLDDSMSPEFWPGCVILIDPTGRATQGSYVLAKVDSSEEEYVFRQLHQDTQGQWILAALNDQYPNIKADKLLSNIVGVIVQRAGKRRHQHKRYDPIPSRP